MGSDTQHVSAPIPVPEGFVGRSKEKNLFFRRLMGYQIVPIQILGAAKTGKTSFLKYLAAQPPTPSFSSDKSSTLAVIYVDLAPLVLQETKSKGFFRLVAQTIYDSFSEKGLPCPSLPDQEHDSRQFPGWLSTLRKKIRIVVLLDDFDSFCKAPDIDANFFGVLRSLSHGNFCWVPVTRQGLYETVSQKCQSSQWVFSWITSLYGDAIYVGALTQEETDLLIRSYAHSTVSISYPEKANAEVECIRLLAGGVPSVVHITADEWFYARRNGIAMDSCGNAVREELLRPKSFIRDLFDRWWRHFTAQQKDFLHAAAAGRVNATASGWKLDVSNELQQYGFVRQMGGTLEIYGDLFRYWLSSHQCSEPCHEIHTRNKVFISYSHKDQKQMGELKTMISPLVGNGSIEIWSDKDIHAGLHWKEEIQRAMDLSKAVIFLVSPSFIDSDFIKRVELPYFFEKHKSEGIKIYCIHIDHSMFESVAPLKNDPTTLSSFQALNDPRNPLKELSKPKQGKELKSMCKKIEALCGNPSK